MARSRDAPESRERQESVILEEEIPGDGDDDLQRSGLADHFGMEKKDLDSRKLEYDTQRLAAWTL